MGEFVVIENLRGRNKFEGMGLKIYEDEKKPNRSSIMDICFRQSMIESLGWEKGSRVTIEHDAEGKRFRLALVDSKRKCGYAVQRSAATYYVRLATPKTGFPKTLPLAQIDSGDFITSKEEKSVIMNYGSYLPE